MSTVQGTHETRGVRQGVGMWLAIAALAIALAVVLHAALPRYTFSSAQDGSVVLVFDRWTGQFQRATYGTDGEPRVTSVVKPF
jgi:hypothetical protein